jgi:tricorn protease
LRTIAFALAALLTASSYAGSAVEDVGPPPGGLLRFPHIGRDFVAFVYGGDIWRAPSAGGPASRLTSHAGLELFPRISPDGLWIAFSAEYTGTRQVYVMPAWGGPPRQLTFYNDVGPMPPRGGWDAWVMGWTPEGKILVRLNRVPWSNRMGRYFVVDPKGGLETPLVLPEGGSASLSADGRRIAYTPVDREFRTWKRTRGGRAQDIWIYDFAANRSERLTDDPATDNFPMWAGDTVYFTSDRERVLNLYACDLRTKVVRKVTHFTDEDVLWPSLGPDAIVFMNGGHLHRLDLKTEKSERIPIQLGAAIDTMVPQFRDVTPGTIGRLDLSPTASRVVVEGRGDVFTVPAKEGAPRNLTETPGVREMSPTWSPDGQWIAYLSDATGEYEIYVQPQGGGDARRVTTDGGVWRYAPAWSPDSKKLAFGDRKQRLRILDVAAGSVVDADHGTQEDLDTYRWSPDSRWLAYEKSHPNRIPGLAVYSLDRKQAFMLGDGMTADSSPVFSADGKYLFFFSNRDFNLTFSAFEFDYLYTGATRVYAAALTPDVPPLFPPKSDEEKAKAEEKEKPAVPPADKTVEKPADKPADKPAEKPAPPVPAVAVVAEGFVARTTTPPGVKAGSYRALAAGADAIFYIRAGISDADPTELMRYDLKERKEEKVVDGATAFVLSRDGKKLLYRAKDDWFLTDAKAGAKAGEGKIDLARLKVKVDLHAEWAQMFADAWRIARDWFYDPAMHGVDWAGLKKRYGALVPYVSHRSDLDFILGEMLSELEAGHTYVASGDEPKVPRVLGGMLGAELVADASGRYRIAKIYEGENWDEASRSPLTEAGVRVKEGSFLLAIDGHDLRTTDNPYRLLENKAAVPVVLKVADSAEGAGAREVTVRPVSSELGLLYLDWVKGRMRLADKLSGGKVGYIHLPDTSTAGNRMLQKMFYSQAGKAALIVDDRYNGGGFIPDRMIEYFTRRTLAWWARRGIDSFTTPGFAHDGPKVMLINGYSASGGDALPYFFRENGLGPLIGTRTWGGLIGLSGNPALMDGGSVQIPTFRIYDRRGKWIIENEGVSPDVEVIDLPERRIAGGDPSLEKAVEILLAELAKRPGGPPPVPAPPRMVPSTR